MDREASEIIDGMMQSFGMTVIGQASQREKEFDPHDYGSFRKGEDFIEQFI